MSVNGPPIQIGEPPAVRRSPAGDVGAFLVTFALLVSIFYLTIVANPLASTAGVILGFAIAFAGKSVSRTVASRLDGHRSDVRFPGIGTIHVQFSSR